ncbi:MAG TPA: xanthine dehydrogenase family protein molybdopterin-binding subunit [Dongiaceae bacterium]|nr:xanthine dehydrogenase family protein molybdopterin-binding subunit [Dongiaceae bacterium]
MTGHGRYIDDIDLPHQLYAYVLRSPHAHARLRGIDKAAAEAAPGVAAVFTGADLAAEGVGGIAFVEDLTNRDGSPIVAPPRPILAVGKVRHVGDGVALVVAGTLAQARDAAELIAVEYDPLLAVTEAAAALAPGAPQIWDEAPGNLCLDWETGDARAVEAAFRKADRVCRLSLVNNRIIVASLEPRGALGAYDPGTGRYTLYTSSQGSHHVRNSLADKVLRVPRERVRVVTPDVGGGFGMKLFLYPEHALVAWAARRLGRPVKWTPERSDSFMSDTQGRDHRTTAELALDKTGRFLALRVSTLGNLGGYLSEFGPMIPTVAGSGMLAGLYTTPAIHVAVKGVFTNTVPTDAYRGAGRPEAAYVVERMADVAAREIGLSPAEIRRRNFIPPEAMPFTTALGETYDSGDFARNLDDALRLSGWDAMPARRAAAKARGRRRGIGMSAYIEACGGELEDMAELRFEPNGAVALLIGTQSNGQGHATAFAQIVADGLGLALDKVRLVQGDTDQIPYGNGTGGSRSLAVGGNAISAALRKIVDKGKRIAAIQMEAAEADIEFADGVFTVAGTDRRMTIAEVAAAAYDPERQAAGMEFGLAERSVYLPKGTTYPNGCHVAEVEVDIDTGVVTLVAHTVVDDFGRVVNPLLLAGQVHGGTAQGVGQALFESCVYDPETGQLLSGSFVDYRVPRAADLPSFAVATNEVPCRTNPMGIKGAGEAGAIGAPPAVINAIVDALAEFGVTHLDMPATPERVWRAIRDAVGAR